MSKLRIKVSGLYRFRTRRRCYEADLAAGELGSVEVDPAAGELSAGEGNRPVGELGAEGSQKRVSARGSGSGIAGLPVVALACLLCRAVRAETMFPG